MDMRLRGQNQYYDEPYQYTKRDRTARIPSTLSRTDTDMTRSRPIYGVRGVKDR